MRYLPVLSVLVVVCLLPVLASNPGEPLDCSDWVFLEPGLSCSTEIVFPCENATGATSTWCKGNTLIEPDNLGGQLVVRIVSLFGEIDCGWGPTPYNRAELVRWDGVTEYLLGYVDERCGPPGSGTVDGMGGAHGALWQLIFDEEGGALRVVMASYCAAVEPPYDCQYANGHTLIRIEGFTTTVEVLQTYTPAANEIGFRVPYMPEGFQYADFFDTYWGDLDTVGDWSQAQPLQCGYPGSPPSTGDYLTVEDTLPPLELEQGRYYVTAVTHQGQTRYGRKSSGGVLTGRDPAVLPGCGE